MKISGFNSPKATVSALALALSGLVAVPALADEVALKSADGTVNITGEFVDFKDDHYVIRTALGDLRISAARVRCEGAACPTFETASADLRIAGSDTVGLGLMPLLLSGYAAHLDAEASIKGTEVEGQIIAEMIADGGFGDEIGSVLVTSSTSSTGFKTLLADGSDISMSSRRIKPQEARDLKEAGAGNMISPDQEHIVAVDMLVMITHPTNPVNSISTDQLRDIYAGKITNWKQLGGEDLAIKVVNRQDDSGTRSVFDNNIFGDAAETLASQIIAKDNSTVASLVNDDAAAIGYVGYAFQRGAKPLNVVNECGISTEPDAFAAKVEEYALQRRLYLYNRAETTEMLNDFVDYSTSADADGVIAKSGFIDLGIQRKTQDMTGSRARMLLDPNVDAYEGGVMREMLGEMVNYDRLSTTFRFRTGSSKLDERARLDMKRLVDFLADQPEGTNIMFVGFTDDVGAFDSNRNLSVNRAQQVIEELRGTAGANLDGIQLTASGYGEVAPSACNTSDNGRGVNRRVEVWIEAAPRG